MPESNKLRNESQRMINLSAVRVDGSALAILIITLCFAIWASAGEISGVTIVVVAGITSSCLLFGRATLHVLPVALPNSARFPAGMLAGIAIVSVGMLIVCFGLKISAGFAYLLVCAVGFVCLGLNSIRSSGPRIDGASMSSPLTPIVVSFICGTSLVWSWQAIRSFARLRTEGILHAWVDFFFHSTVIAQFGHFSALNGTSMFSYGARIPLYHWASYMLPAVLCTFSSTPALVLATSFWVLLGFIAMAMGAWVLGAILADWRGAIAAVLLILLVPNAAHYGLRNHFFDFAWLVEISAGLSFGIGLSLLAIGLFVIALRNRNVFVAGAAMILVLAEAAFKMHFMATLFPACILFFILRWRWARPNTKFVILGAFISATLLLMLLGEGISRAPHLFTGAHNVSKILSLMLDMKPSAAPNLFPKIANSTPLFISTPIGILLVLIAATGLLLPAYFLGWALLHKLRLARPADCFPLLLLVVYCSVIVCFPTDTFTGDPTEYQHRNFVLIYAVLSAWCSYFAVALANHRWPRRLPLILAGCACCMLPVPLLLEPTAQTNVLKWTKSSASNPVASGLFESAQYIRRVAPRGDVVVASSFKDEVALVALSERRALLIMDENYARGLSYSSKAIVNRRVVGQQLAHAGSYQEMRRIAQAHAINWYVVAPDTPLPAALKKRRSVQPRILHYAFVTLCWEFFSIRDNQHSWKTHEATEFLWEFNEGRAPRLGRQQRASAGRIG